MTRKFRLLIGLALLAVAASSSVALAAVNVKVLPAATFSGTKATVSDGEFSGLGSTEAIAHLTATGVATYQCENPTGKVVPGQNPVEAQAGESGPVGLGNSEHNGRGTISTISAEVKAPPTPSAKTVACGGAGNTKWKVTLTGVKATGAHLEITQGKEVVFCRAYTLGGPETGAAC